VRPGAATVIELHGGDRVTVIDPDGGQPAELTALAPDGRDDLAGLGATADSDATVLRAAEDGFVATLHERGLDRGDAVAVMSCAVRAAAHSRPAAKPGPC
jgi:aminomethyltransferase